MPRAARSPESYENEQFLLAQVPELLAAHGFTAVNTSLSGGMKFIDAKAADGSPVRFWLKQGWSTAKTYAAIQFGMLPASPEPRTDAELIAKADGRVAGAKALGARYLLLVQMQDSAIRSNYVALDIDDVPLAFRRQLTGWPSRARNGNSPSLYFDDERSLPEAACINVVKELAVPLAAISGLTPAVKGAAVDAKTVWAEIERRMKQAAFRLRVGDRCGWKCVVSGNEVREVLDAAHLPGKNWRHDNEAGDGVLLRVDLHRLLDRGLAELRDGRFWLCEDARCEHYSQFDGRPIE